MMRSIRSDDGLSTSVPRSIISSSRPISRGGREAERRLAVAVELLGRRRRAQRREPLRRHVHRPRRLQAERLHARVDRVRAADHAVEHFGGGVVRHDDHHRDQILHRHHRAVVEPLNRAGARLRVGLDERVLVGQLELAGLDLLEHLDHQRDLDRAHRLHLTIGVDRDLLAGLERLHVDAPRRVDAARGPQDRRLEPLQRRLLRVCAEPDREAADDQRGERDSAREHAPTQRVTRLSSCGHSHLLEDAREHRAAPGRPAGC